MRVRLAGRFLIKNPDGRNAMTGPERLVAVDEDGSAVGRVPAGTVIVGVLDPESWATLQVKEFIAEAGETYNFEFELR